MAITHRSLGAKLVGNSRVRRQGLALIAARLTGKDERVEYDWWLGAVGPIVKSFEGGVTGEVLLVIVAQVGARLRITKVGLL